MTVPFLDLRRQHDALRAELDAALAEVLDGDRFIGGPRVEAFERAFAAFCGAREAVGVASGTDAIELALRALGIGAGDEVITAANTCVPTVAGIEATGATPCSSTSTRSASRSIRASSRARRPQRTKAIVPVHLYGQCADMDAICAARAASTASSWSRTPRRRTERRCGGRRAGTLGAAAAFSFYPTKNLGALGDGGAVVTDDPDVAGARASCGASASAAGGEAVRRGVEQPARPAPGGDALASSFPGSSGGTSDGACSRRATARR